MEFQSETDRVYWQDEGGRLMAEVMFPKVEDGVVEINHVFVDPAARGQGVAGSIMTATAEKLRAEGKKAIASCSYAKKWFEKHPQWKDVKK